MTKIRFVGRLVGVAGLASFLLPTNAKDERRPPDWRNIETGYEIPDESYCDQPYIVITRDGNWLCVLTTGKGEEGEDGQHIVATISSDQGKAWSKLIPIEEPGGPVASWVMPLVTKNGRVYVFYDYNGDKISGMRADMLGWYCYRYSDDHGKTWSQTRYRLPVRVTAADRSNGMNGIQIFWGIGKPIVAKDRSGEYVIFGFTKLGKYMLDNGEGWFFRSNNILTEPDPEKIQWQMLPDGDHGLRAPEHGSVQEEHNIVALSDGTLYCMYRTTRGYPCHAYSHDGGHSWTKPIAATYTPGGRGIKHPRACPRLFKCQNGKYLFWMHNNGNHGWEGGTRNPVWLLGGIEKGGQMYWSQPEMLLYDLTRYTEGMSYPDLVESDGKYWISETQKTTARVHPVDPNLLEGMWQQVEAALARRLNTKRVEDSLALSLDMAGIKAAMKSGGVPMPKISSLLKDESFTIDLWIRLESLALGQVVLETSDEDKDRILRVSVAELGKLRLAMGDGVGRMGMAETDAGLLQVGKLHHVSFIVDAGPDIISSIVDDRFCDGGSEHQFGYKWLDPYLEDVTTAGKTLKLAPSLKGELESLRIYNRHLRTVEAIQNYFAGIK
jgi:hypothetical protein